jgi:Protein of unknown function (DUF2726)
MLKWGELDFLVVNREGGFGIAFGVEFDGPYHDRPERAAKDRIKDELLLRADIPLVRVPDSAPGEREQITLLEWVVECFLILRTRRADVEATVKDLRQRWADQAADAIRKGEVSPEAPVPFLPFTTVGAIVRMNPFPAIAAVRQRLEDRYGIVGFGFPDEPVTGYETSEEMGAAFERFNNADLLLDFASQIVASEHVGIGMFAADNALAEYQALAEVDKWAERNIARIDQG